MTKNKISKKYRYLKYNKNQGCQEKNLKMIHI